MKKIGKLVSKVAATSKVKKAGGAVKSAAGGMPKKSSSVFSRVASKSKGVIGSRSK